MERPLASCLVDSRTGLDDILQDVPRMHTDMSTYREIKGLFHLVFLSSILRTQRDDVTVGIRVHRLVAGSWKTS